MTNALAQNITNEKNAAIDLLARAINVSTNSEGQNDTKETGFSNILNNLDARTQKAQKNFDKKTVVSNTSSINKKALTKQTHETTNIENNQKQILNNNKKEEVKLNNSDKVSINKEAKETSSVSIDSKKSNTTQEVEKDIITDSNKQENLSDINNSSLVESSPVFSSDKKDVIDEEVKIEIEKAIEEIEINVQEIINTIPAIDETIAVENQDLKTKIKDLVESLEEFENPEEIIKAIENISSNLDNSTLNQETKDELQNALEDIKEFVDSIDLNADNTADFSEIINKLNDKIQSALDNSATKEEIKPIIDTTLKNKDNSLVKNTKEVVEKVETTNTEILKSTDDKEVQKEAPEIKIDTEDSSSKIEVVDKKEGLETKELNSEEIKTEVKVENEVDLTKDIKIDTETVDKLNKITETLAKDVKEAVDVSNKEAIVKIDKTIDETINQLEVLAKENEKLSVDLNEKLIEPLKTLKETLPKVEEDTTVIEADFSNENVFEALDELKNIDFEKIDTLDKKSTKEIVKILDNLDENLTKLDINEEISKEIKTQIESLVKQVEDKTISTEEFEQAVDIITENIKTEVEIKDTQALNENNTIDITSEFEKFSSTNNQSFSQKENNSSQTNDLNRFKFEKVENTQEFETELSLNETIEADFEPKQINLKGSVNNLDTKNIEENLQKAIYTQEVMEEMMVEVNIKTIPSQSGALSVADEVARLAMNETTSLNPITSAHGSVTYDSTGLNAVIKNAASLMKSTTPALSETPLMEDVLNQVANKISQLKDGATQKLTMVLRPLDLGRLSIELSTNQNGLTTQIMAQNEEVRAYIEKNIDSLRQQLSDAGVNVNSIQIKTAGQEGSTSYEGNQNLNKDQQENQNQGQNQNNKDGEQKQNNSKEAKDFIASMSNYDMHFAKDFSSILNKSLNYNLN